MAHAYLNKAAAVRAEGDHRTAVSFCDRAIALYEPLVQENGRDELRADLDRALAQRAETATVPWTGRVPLPVASLDPRVIVRMMLAEANTGTKELEVLRGFRDEKELGRGGQGAVFLIQHQATGDRVALKIVLPKGPLAREKFEREVGILKTLNHPNVVRLLNWGVWQDVYFFTSEYCDGGDVTRLIAERGGRLSPPEARPIILQALDGLDYGHHAKVRVQLADGPVVEAPGVVHRDIKPHNLFLCRSGESWIAKLGDYGLAKAFETSGESGLTPMGIIGGSLQFMSQHLLAFKYAKSEVDVWAAAATLYFMLTGTSPRDFPKEQPKTWVHVVSTTHPRPIRERGVPIPDQLADLIDLALDDRDQLRFQSAAEFRRSLEAVPWTLEAKPARPSG